MNNLEIYNAIKQPPKEALRTIQGGRLSGKTDINPQWRYKTMTEQFGICGVGWKFETTKLWTEQANDSQVFAFAQVNVYIKQGDSWSEPIPGCGGSMLIEKEKAGLHANDEGYKMAITDALSTAMKMIGVAADIYAGLWDGAKYQDDVTKSTEESKVFTKVIPLGLTKEAEPKISDAQTQKIYASVKEKNITITQAKAYLKEVFKKMSTKELTISEASRLIEDIEAVKLNKGGVSALVKEAKKLVETKEEG